MRQLFLHVSLFLLSLCTFPLHATIIHVPGDSSTIQGGINGAVDGDTVLVADGIYTDDGNRDIDFTGKAIVVMSENGPEVTIVDCEGASIGFYFRSDESPTSVLKGFTITHGSHWEWPGAILISYTSPTIINCIFLENSARYGAIYSQGDYSNHNQPRLIDCTFIANSAPTFGGGMNCTYSSPMLTNCTFSENFGPIGGGLRCLYSSPTLTNCTFSGNSATDYGGAIRFHSPYGSGPTLTNCTFSGNSTSGYGGAIYVFDGVPAQLTNCIFSENSAEKGGGMYNNSSNPTVTNCTFSENDADRGGGMYNANSRPTVTNCILWGDSIDEIYNSVGDPIVTYSDVQGGYPGEGNIDADPLFFTLGGFEYFLDAGSPCIDAGIPLI